MPNKPVYEIDGAAFSTLEEFYDEVSRKVIPNASWGHHLDAFNDILRGDLERQMRVSCYVGKNSELSRQRLNY